MPSGYDSTTKDNLVLNVMVLYVNGTLVGAVADGDKFGLTKGGVDFDPGRKDRDVEFDGKRGRVAGLEYPIDYESVMKGKIITFGAAQIGYLESGATSDVAGEQTTYTPKPCGELYAEGDYLTDVLGVCERGDGGMVVVKFAVGRVTKWKLDTKDKQEAELDFEIHAYISDEDAQESTDKAPYQLIDVAAA